MARVFRKESLLFISVLLGIASARAGIRSVSPASDTMTPSASKVVPVNGADDTGDSVAADAAASGDATPVETRQVTKPVRSESLPDQATRADAFVAAADWEFDGFVSGGQDSSVRSMFYLNDLLYLNIGSQQGIAKGDRLEIFKRGDKVRDPQSGRFIGYEVRRAAVVLATDRVEDDACAVRIVRTHEPVEVGDLVRRIQ